MKQNIEAIILDTGNTLTTFVPDPAFQAHVLEEITGLLGVKEAPAKLLANLEAHYKEYKAHVKETLLEPSEVELWTRWMVPDLPPGRIAPAAPRLTALWTQRRGRRTARPDARATLVELQKRGYVLGLLANALSRTEIPDWLEKEKLKPVFKSVVLSSTFGRRKPDPYIFLESARLAGVEAEHCAYVGDNPSRDIQGARGAGFGAVVIFLEAATLLKEPPKVKERPDAMISKVADLLNIFPPK